MKNEVKLIALDLDNTILFDRKFANENDLKELQRLQEAGYFVTVSTGQGYNTAVVFAKQIGIDKYVNKMICQNGSYITSVDKFEPEHVNTISPELLKEVISYFKKENIGMIFLKYDDFGTYYYVNFSEEQLVRDLGTKLKYVEIDETSVLEGFSFVWLSLKENEVNEILPPFEKAFHDKLSITLSQSDDRKGMELMISDKKATKGARLLNLAEQLNLTPNQVLAFGDGGNDISMFESVKHSVAMGNARQEVKDSAVYVTDDCLESGVANFLKEHF